MIYLPKFSPLDRMSRDVVREMVTIGATYFGAKINRRSAKKWLDHCSMVDNPSIDALTKEYFIHHEHPFTFTYEYLGFQRLIFVNNEPVVNPWLKDLEYQFYADSKAKKAISLNL